MNSILSHLFAFHTSAAGLSTPPVIAGEFRGASVEKTNFTMPTPAMAVRGHLFYIDD